VSENKLRTISLCGLPAHVVTAALLADRYLHEAYVSACKAQDAHCAGDLDAASDLYLQACQHRNRGEAIYARLAGDQFEEMSMTDQPKSKLAQRLADLHRKAVAAPGQRQTTTLAGGLRIDLIAGLDGMTRILLARQGAYPSDAEWRTTLAHFPYQPPAVTPERIEYRGWQSLRAGWPSPEVKE
jgi:hypothetical protein